MTIEYVPERNAQVWPRCGRCGCVWRQSGNRTGHCSSCHRTFDGETAFTRHQTIRDGKVTCHDPMTLTHIKYKKRIGDGVFDKGVVYYGIKPESSLEDMLRRIERL